MIGLTGNNGSPTKKFSNFKIDKPQLNSLLVGDKVTPFEKYLIEEGIKRILMDGLDSVTDDMVKFLSDPVYGILVKE